MSARVGWLVPETSGGVNTYSVGLWETVKEALSENGMNAVDPVYCDKLKRRSVGELAEIIGAQHLDILHVQHEYGLFGSKLPGRYSFPALVSALRAVSPDTALIATAHTVLPNSYRYDLSGRGLRVPLRALANLLIVPSLRRLWNPMTWGSLDGVIVHSKRQVSTITRSGCANVAEIPHYVPVRINDVAAIRQPDTLLIFGYISPEKGQDVAIRALAQLPPEVHLTIAGGLRRSEDSSYFKKCETLISDLGLRSRVTITGFVPEQQIDDFYRKATLVLAPFRATSGSGSLAQAFARGAAVLASDLPLNREINERVPGAIALFRAGDDEDCGRNARAILDDWKRLAKLRERSLEYAEKNSATLVAKSHVAFYEQVLRSR